MTVIKDKLFLKNDKSFIIDAKLTLKLPN